MLLIFSSAAYFMTTPNDQVCLSGELCAMYFVVQEVQTLQAQSHYRHHALSIAMYNWWLSARSSLVDTCNNNALADTFYMRKTRTRILHCWLQEVSLQQLRTAALVHAIETVEKAQRHERIVRCWEYWHSSVALARGQKEKADKLFEAKSQRLVLVS